MLDLGGGDGFAALPFLEFGARVTTVDISSNQLQKLRTSAGNRSPMLEVRCENVFEALSSIEGRSHRYDIVLASSFLHHVPDYLKLIRDAAAVTAAYGQFLSIEDPMRYDSMKRFDLAFSAFAYFSWRIFRHDPIGGFRRYLRRKRETSATRTKMTLSII